MRVPLVKWRHTLPELVTGRFPRKGRFKLGYIGLDAPSASTEPESSQESGLPIPYWACVHGIRPRFGTTGDKQPLTEHEIALSLSNLSNSTSLIKVLSQIYADANPKQRQLVERARLGRVLLPAIQSAAGQGLITTTDDRPHRPVTVTELLSLYAGNRIKPSLFDLILAACIANTGKQDVSLIPMSSIKRFLDGDADQEELGLLAHQYFRPTMVTGASSSAKTVLFRDPRAGTTSIAICEITTSNTITGNFRVNCEVVLCCALGHYMDCTTPTADFTDFQNRTQMFLEALFPSHRVPWAWWQCSAQDSDPESQPLDRLGRNADWALRTSVFLDPRGTTEDPALQLLDLLFNLFTPTRLGTISKIMGYDSFLSTEVDDIDASGDVSDEESVGGSDAEEVDFGLWVRPIHVLKVQMTVARQLALALDERVATKQSFLTATQSRPSVDCGIPKHLGDVGDASDANEYDAGASDDGAEEDSIYGVDDTYLWYRTRLKMCKVLATGARVVLGGKSSGLLENGGLLRCARRRVEPRGRSRGRPRGFVITKRL
ncbi:hypothetical protein CDV36_006627 [Fusarium kuroshium]|uniref:Uncharacterized protein n=1 Tax=Fusarium kuroshium TaxID=2010991 RepID=A0A3M2S910_9HYPO|nr:hypothetical protein CDV36_006627 [Fusarium kuroshium]